MLCRDVAIEGRGSVRKHDLTGSDRLMHVAAIQLAGADGEREAIVDRVLSLIARAGEAGVELAALPELALSPYFAARPDADPGEYDNTIGDELTSRVAAAAQAAGLWLVLPIR